MRGATIDPLFFILVRIKPLQDSEGTIHKMPTHMKVMVIFIQKKHTHKIFFEILNNKNKKIKCHFLAGK